MWLFLGMLAAMNPPAGSFPETCQIEEVRFEEGNECSPVETVTYCPQTHRTYLTTYRMKKIGEDKVCLPVSREMIDIPTAAGHL